MTPRDRLLALAQEQRRRSDQAGHVAIAWMRQERPRPHHAGVEYEITMATQCATDAASYALAALLLEALAEEEEFDGILTGNYPLTV